MELNFSTPESWLLLIYAAVILIQLAYYWVIFSRFAFYKPVPSGPPKDAVSVVICAKNEYRNLKKNLPLILTQDYPEFEVVVVNDASDDETIFLLEDLDREYPRMKVVTIAEDLNFFKGKKFPLALGIKSAKYENLLLTDADCEPAGDQWMAEMMKGFGKLKEVVLGYGPYYTTKGFLNQIISFETAFTALQYFSLALWGQPYMGVGRNLAYKKSLFIKNKGFTSHYNVSSGDDDLFINKVANKQNTSIIVSPESFTSSEAKKMFSEWWRQKRRHLSTGKYYKPLHKFILGGYSVSLFLTYTGLIVLVILNYYFLPAIILFLIRLLSQYILFKKTFKRLGEKKLLLISPIIELFLTLFYPVVVGFNLVFKQNKWK